MTATIEAPTTVKPVFKKKPQPTGVDIRDPKIRDIFKKNGIPAVVDVFDASEHSPGYTEPMFLELNDKRTQLTVDTGTADMKVYFDKKRRQCVIVATEKARKITREYTVSQTFYTKKTTQKSAKEALAARAAVGYGFPVTLPRDAEVRYEVVETKDFTFSAADAWRSPSATMIAKVTAHVKATRTAFLIGYDEEHMFISALPKIVTSVERAHEVLRPKGVPADAIRVGEFFFVPVVDEKLDLALDAAWIKDEYNYEPQSLPSANGSENHMVTMACTYAGKEYAAGLVWDTEKRHSNLWLDGWYEVHHNLEVESDSADGANWD